MDPKPVLVRGGQLRDEFVCPITRELMKDPVIAADGHTYDRSAIEQWLMNHRRSPKTGEVMEATTLIRNINLLKLIRDLVHEGGEGLYLHEAGGAKGGSSSPGGYRFALLRQKVLTLKCLGPTESTWNGRSFRVFSSGVIGGRRRPSRQTDRDHVPFSDATVSRRHFEVVQNGTDGRYYIRDMGSAGGTFLRIQVNERIPVFAGLMFMVGKHQMVVQDLDAVATEGAEDRDDATEVGAALGRLNVDDSTVVPVQRDGSSSKVVADGDEEAEGLDPEDMAEFAKMPALHSCVLECFAPEGTPMQGKTFDVPRKGVSLGRKQVNDVSFSQIGEDGVCLGIDSSVSGIHSRVDYDEAKDALQLMDGSGSKPSTNGTWVRLSKMHEESKFYPLRAGVEVLVGTVRFVTSIDEVIVEKDILEDDALLQYAEEAAGLGQAQTKAGGATGAGAKVDAKGVRSGVPPSGADAKLQGSVRASQNANRPRRKDSALAGFQGSNSMSRADSGGGTGEKGTATVEFVQEMVVASAAARGEAADDSNGSEPCDVVEDADARDDDASDEYGTDDEMPRVTGEAGEEVAKDAT